MKSVLISIKPKWCDLIDSGKKTIEVRKTRPKCDTPFKCYIYCTKAKQILRYVEHTNTPYGKPIFCKTKDGSSAFCEERYGNGKVIGEFVCDKITNTLDISGEEFFTTSCMTLQEWIDYTEFATSDLYAWHISDLVIYDKPIELSVFKKIKRDCWYADLGLAKRDCPECKNQSCFIQRPPQSWMYVEGLK